MNTKNKLILLSMTIISGILTAVTLQYDILYPLSYISLSPFFYCILSFWDEGTSYRKLYGIGMLWSMSYYMVVYSFFLAMYPMDFLGLSKITGGFMVVFCQVGLSLLQSIATAFIVPLTRLACHRKSLSPLIFSALWIILEWLQNFTWAGVPFLRLAISQTSFALAMQSASILGSLFLSFIPTFSSAAIGYALFCLKKYGRQYLLVKLYPIIAILLIGTNLIFGAVKITCYSDNTDRGVKVALIQANIGSMDKWEDGQMINTIERHIELSQRAIDESGAEFIVFAETAINYNFIAYEDPTVKNRFASFAKDNNVTLLIGTFTSDAEQNSYNSTVIFYPDGSIEDEPYNKRRLVPFGEFVPMEDLLRVLFPFLTDMNLFEGQITAGNDSEVKEAAGGKIGRLICFDSIYDYLTRKTSADGAEMLLLSTNDSWYLDSPAVYIHNDHAKLRAVESGKYLLRAANTGVSSIIDPLGRTKSELGPLKEGIVIETAYFNSERTIYSYTGNIIVIIAFIFIAYEAAEKIISKKRGNN